MFANKIVNPDGVREEAEYVDDPELARKAMEGLTDKEIREAIMVAGEGYLDEFYAIHDAIQSEAVRVLMHQYKAKHAAAGGEEG